MAVRRSTGAALAVSGIAVACALTLAGCGNSSGSSSSSSSAAAPSPTSTVPTEAVVGLTVDEATAWATAHQYTVRVVSVDGTQQPVTMDMRPDRINLVAANGKVESATMG